jgi:hypothetical protein
MEEFKQNLPIRRLEDYNEFVRRMHPKSSNSTNKNSVETASNIDSEVDDNRSVNNFDDGKSPRKQQKTRK